MQKYIASIVVRFMSGSGVKRIKPGEVFEEKDIPPEHFASLKKGGELRPIIDTPNGPIVTPEGVPITSSLGGPTISDTPKTEIKREAVFDLDPATLTNLNLTDLRQMYSEICTKYGKKIQGSNSKQYYIDALSVDFQKKTETTDDPVGETTDDQVGEVNNALEEEVNNEDKDLDL